MKELSIEEKAKRYDEALKVLHKYDGANIMFSQSLKEEMFPELAESEDERIRRQTLKVLNYYKDEEKSEGRMPAEIDECIAWLEKQGEYKSADKIEPKFKVGDTITDPTDSTFTFHINAIKDGKYMESDKDWVLIKEADSDYELVEQKPTDNVIEEEKPLLEKFKQAVYDCAWGKVTCKKEGETKEEYANRWAEHFLLIVRDWADDYIDFTIQQKLRNSYEKGKTDIIEKQDEQKPAWSEEDENRINRLIAYFEDKESFTAEDDIVYANWLESLKDRVQPKQEWSEEDESLRRRCIGAIDMANLSDYTKDSLLNWLYSLKDRILPQLRQEWSEEDIVAIDCAVEVLSKDLPSLAASIERLKSLRPQNRWKPSDAQMASITCAVRNMKESACYDSELVSLLNDLKRLKG